MTSALVRWRSLHNIALRYGIHRCSKFLNQQQTSSLTRSLILSSVSRSSINETKSKGSSTDDQADRYAKILNLPDGSTLPKIKLADGSRMQTGTVATMLRNIERYNNGERGDVEKELEESVPTLIKVGLFNLFPLDEWLNTTNPGRKFLAEKARLFLARS